MLMIPNGIPHEARSDPAIWQVQGTHHAEEVPAKRICSDNVLNQDGGSHAKSLEALPGLEKDCFGSYEPVADCPAELVRWTGAPFAAWTD